MNSLRHLTAVMFLFASSAGLAADPGPIATDIATRCNALLGMPQFSESDTPLASILNQALSAGKIDLARICAETVSELQKQCPDNRCKDSSRGDKSSPAAADQHEAPNLWLDRLPGTWRIGDNWNFEVRPRGSTPNRFDGELGATIRDPEIQRLQEMTRNGQSDDTGWGKPPETLDPHTQQMMNDLMQQLQKQIREQKRPLPQPKSHIEHAPQPNPFDDIPDVLAPPPTDASSSLRE